MKITLTLTLKRPAGIPRTAWKRWTDRIGAQLVDALPDALEARHEVDELLRAMRCTDVQCSGPEPEPGDIVVYHQDERIGLLAATDEGDTWLQDALPDAWFDAGFTWLEADEDTADLLAQLHAQPELTVVEEEIDE